MKNMFKVLLGAVACCLVMGQVEAFKLKKANGTYLKLKSGTLSYIETSTKSDGTDFTAVPVTAGGFVLTSADGYRLEYYTLSASNYGYAKRSANKYGDGVWDYEQSNNTYGFKVFGTTSLVGALTRED